MNVAARSTDTKLITKIWPPTYKPLLYRQQSKNTLPQLGNLLVRALDEVVEPQEWPDRHQRLVKV